MWNWFKLFNADAFMAEELTSRNLVAVLQDVGTENVLISRGNLLSITFRGVYMPISLLDINPSYAEDYGVLKDSNGDVWLGIES